ncbi:hypothetical protein EDD22DRAFT_847624 [Suillus occidentalis]|nr:hypothetical protein EDD22DRAFT_847624 [Suillus occidentalis]
MSMTSLKIMAITLSHMDLEKIELLDHGQNNWGTLSAKIHNYLLLKHGGGYLLGIIAHPDDTLDSTSATLSTHSCTEDQDFLLPFTDIHDAWMALRSHYEQLTDLVRHIYTISIPKEKDFLTILMLNAMGKDLLHIHNHVANAIIISTPSAPYGPSSIHSHLELKQQLIDNDKGKGTGDVVMIISNKDTTGSMKPSTTPMSCPTKGASTGKPGGLCYDTNGYTYILDAKIYEMIFITSAPAPSLSGTTTPT